MSVLAYITGVHRAAPPILGPYGINDHACIIWLDRDSITGVGDGLAITTGWPDTSGNSWNMATQSGSADPKWSASVLGGSVKFEHALGQAFSNTAFSGLYGSNGFTLFCVAQHTGYTLATIGPGYSNSVLYGYASGGDFQLDDNGLAWRVLYPFAPAAVSHVFEFAWDGFAAFEIDAFRQWLDGVAKTETFIGSPSITLDNGLIIGQGIGVGYLDGYVAEWIIYDGVLSDAERNSVRAQLAAKYSITVI